MHVHCIGLSKSKVQCNSCSIVSDLYKLIGTCKSLVHIIQVCTVFYNVALKQRYSARLTHYINEWRVHQPLTSPMAIFPRCLAWLPMTTSNWTNELPVSVAINEFRRFQLSSMNPASTAEENSDTPASSIQLAYSIQCVYSTCMEDVNSHSEMWVQQRTRQFSEKKNSNCTGFVSLPKVEVVRQRGL